MLSSLLLALVVIAIVCIVAGVILRYFVPAQFQPIIWGIVAIICLIVLYQAVIGHRLIVS